MNLEDLVNRARRLAPASNCRSKMASIIFRSKKSIIATGVNKRGYRNSSIHAEIDALRSLRSQKKRANGASILIARFHKNGDFGMAKPCANCIEVLKMAGIKKVAWTTKHQTIEIANISVLNNDYLTRRHEGDSEVVCIDYHPTGE